jgi:hypothetical protein
MPTVRNIEKATEHDNYRFSAVVLEVVKSMPFQMKLSARKQELSAAAGESGR